MKYSIVLTILLCVCVALPDAAQTLDPNNMVQIPAGKFWMGRTQGTYRDAVEKIQR